MPRSSPVDRTAAPSGKLDVALSTCMKGAPAPDVDALVATAQKRAADGEIGPLKDLADAHVYLLHGANDGVVAPAVAEAGAQFYQQLRDGNAGADRHAGGGRWRAPLRPQPARWRPRATTATSRCRRIWATAASMRPARSSRRCSASRPARPTLVHGKVLSFDQDALRPDGKDAFLASTGYRLRAAGLRRRQAAAGWWSPCMAASRTPTPSARPSSSDAGFNRWADAYDVAVLYPQTRASFAPLNPQACWDWWGYSGTDYDTRQRRAAALAGERRARAGAACEAVMAGCARSASSSLRRSRGQRLASWQPGIGAKSFRPLSRPGHFSRLAERSNQREATPLRVRGHPAAGRVRFSGVCDSASCPRAKRGRHPCRPPCGPFVRPSPPQRGPGHSRRRIPARSGSTRYDGSLPRT